MVNIYRINTASFPQGTIFKFPCVHTRQKEPKPMQPTTTALMPARYRFQDIQGLQEIHKQPPLQLKPVKQVLYLFS